MLKGSNTFGEVTDGHLDLSAPSVTTTIATIVAANDHRPSSKTRRDNSLLLEKLFPEHVMEPVFADWTWPRFRFNCKDYSDDLVVHCVVLGYEWWGEDDYGMYGILVTPTSLEHRTFRRIGMFDLMPKFRQSDRGLDMQDLIARQEAVHRRYTEGQAWIQAEQHSVLLSGAGLDLSPEYEDAMREVAELKNELRNKAQTMTQDIEFHYFRII